MCNLFLNILEQVEHHGEGVECVLSVQNVDMMVDQNVNVHDVAFLGKKNACYVVLVLNYILVIVKKENEYANLTHLLLTATKPPIVQHPLVPQNRRRHHNLTLHIIQEKEC